MTKRGEEVEKEEQSKRQRGRLSGQGACYKGDMYRQGKWGQKGTRERVWDGRGVTCEGRQNVNSKT